MNRNDLTEILAIIPSLKANSKRQALQIMAQKAAKITSAAEHMILEKILQREQLGCTATGNGIAIPHVKLNDINQITGVFARLEAPIDFESPDNQPVDLVFLLLAPEAAGADHLKALSRTVRVLQNPLTAAKIRSAHDADSISGLLTLPISAEESSSEILRND